MLYAERNVFSWDWDKGLLQESLGSLDDKQAKKKIRAFHHSGYFLPLLSTSSKESPLTFTDEGWHLTQHTFQLHLR